MIIGVKTYDCWLLELGTSDIALFTYFIIFYYSNLYKLYLLWINKYLDSNSVEILLTHLILQADFLEMINYFLVPFF